MSIEWDDLGAQRPRSAAVDLEDLTGDEGGVWSREVLHGGGHVVGLAGAADQGDVYQAPAAVVGHGVTEELGALDEAEGDDVDGDALGAELGRQGVAPAVQGGLGCRVGCPSTAKRGDGGEVDDPPAGAAKPGAESCRQQHGVDQLTSWPEGSLPRLRRPPPVSHPGMARHRPQH